MEGGERWRFPEGTFFWKNAFFFCFSLASQSGFRFMEQHYKKVQFEFLHLSEPPPAFSNQNSDLYQGLKSCRSQKSKVFIFQRNVIKGPSYHNNAPEKFFQLREMDLGQNSWIVLHCSAATLENNLGQQIVKFCHENEQYFQLFLNNEIGSTATQNYPTILA